MIYLFKLAFKVHKRVCIIVIKIFSKILGILSFYGNGVIFFTDIKLYGIPIIDIQLNSSCKIGRNCSINSGTYFNRIGRNQKTILFAVQGGNIEIGNNVGISSSAIISYNEIKIGNNVKIGGNTVIYDSDFHNLDYRLRQNIKTDIPKTAPVIIEDDVFIGSHSTILKGVRIGKCSIIAACSVVTKNIPPMEIWGGNPAKLIRKISDIS